MSRQRRAIVLAGDTATNMCDDRAAVLERLSATVREAYCLSRRELTQDDSYGTSPIPKWDGGTNSFGTRHSPVWPKIAAVILEHQADPLRYVRAQFYSCFRSQPPRPNQLYGEEALENWKQFELNARTALEIRIKSDYNQLQVHTLPFVKNLNWSTDNALGYVLRDSAVPISPIVRYCEAVAINLDCVIQHYEQPALAQYVFQIADYDKLLGAKIPEPFREKAYQICNYVTGLPIERIRASHVT